MVDVCRRCLVDADVWWMLMFGGCVQEMFGGC